jgi:murein L,D-transpeptidase YafK
MAFGTLNAADPPSSPRSREAVQRVTPALRDALDRRGLRLGAPIFVRIFKLSRELEVWVDAGERFQRFKTYPICACSGDPGPKLRIGDLQSPEGFYFVAPERMNPTSRFHLSFNLGFPNSYDRARGRTGEFLMVHGDCVSIGCYAMTNAGIEEIYTLADAAFRNGQPLFRVHVFPFRMTDDNLRAYDIPKWTAFWANLKEGYDWFERTGRPPNVEVAEGRYVFSAQ